MKKIGIFIFWTIQIFVFVWELAYLYSWLGAIGVIVGFVIFPAVWVAMPFIMLFQSGIWLPLLLTVLGFLPWCIFKNTNKSQD